jgi:hypothetical protein
MLYGVLICEVLWMQAFQVVTTSNLAAPTVSQGMVCVLNHYIPLLSSSLIQACGCPTLDTSTHQAINRNIYKLEIHHCWIV